MADLGAIGTLSWSTRFIPVFTAATNYEGTVGAASHKALMQPMLPIWYGTQDVISGIYPFSWHGGISVKYKITGHVLQEGVPLPYVRVRLYSRRHGASVAWAQADATGYVEFLNLPMIQQGYYAIAFDPEGSPLQNAIIWDRLTPAPM